MADIKQMYDALKPFANLVPAYFPADQPDDAQILMHLDSYPVVSVPLEAFRRAAEAMDQDCAAARCIACAQIFNEGDDVIPELSEGGYMHFGCCSPDSYVDGEGQPLKPGDAPPVPEKWTEDPRALPQAPPPDRARLLEMITEAWKNGQTSTAIPSVWAEALIDKFFPTAK